MAFFENTIQMDIPHATVVKLQQEGIDTTSDLAKFDKEFISQIANNLCHSGGRVVNLNNVSSTILTPPFMFYIKS